MIHMIHAGPKVIHFQIWSNQDYLDTEYQEKYTWITLRFNQGEEKQKGQHSETSSENHSSMDNNCNQMLIFHVNYVTCHTVALLCWKQGRPPLALKIHF